MAVSTDRLGLNKLSVFNLLRTKLPKEISEKRNIIDCRDGIIYMWLNEDRVLLTTNLKHLGEGNEHQVLKPSDISKVLHNIHEIKLNNSSTQIAGISNQAVTIFDLPLRWGKEGDFLGGAPEVLVKCHLLTVQGVPSVEQNSCQPLVLKVSWFPDSIVRPYLAVLYSDNCLRIFETTSPTLLQTLQLGRSPPRHHFTVLGDAAVDFDFYPIANIKVENKQHPSGAAAPEKTINVLWIVYILRSNGDVYTFEVDLSVKTVKQQVLEGPFPMCPQEEDNYGIDANSILVLNCSPPIVVISTNNGYIYHCIHSTKPNPTPEIDKQEAVWSDGTLFKPTNSMFYVMEGVKLLDQESEKDPDSLFYNNINLMRDPTSNARYICFHDAGVHVIRMPVVHTLAGLTKYKKEDEAALCNTLREMTCTVDYIVCTHLNNSSVPSSPLLGVRMLSPPDTLIAVLGNGQATSILIPAIVLPPEENEDTFTTSTITRHQPFIRFIENILKQSELKDQPILKLSPDLSTQETQELAMKLIYKCKDARLVHQMALDEIQKRAQVLIKIKEHQTEDIQLLVGEGMERKAKAEQLAERITEMFEKQLVLTKKAEDLLIKAYSLDNDSNSDLNQIKAILKDKCTKVSELWNGVNMLKKRHAYLNEQKQHMEFQNQRGAIFLNKNQSSIIRKSLIEIKTGISGLVQRVMTLNEEIKYEL